MPNHPVSRGLTRSGSEFDGDFSIYGITKNQGLLTRMSFNDPNFHLAPQHSYRNQKKYAIARLA